jgi:hypothetical protein
MTSSHLSNLFRATFDLGVFADVARQRTRRTLVYLLILVLLSTAAATLAITLALRKLAREIEPHLDKIPTVTIRNGRASANVEQPWVQVLEREGDLDVVLIIDTTGTLDDFEKHQMGFFLKERQLLMKDKEQRTRSFDLAHVDDVVIGPDIVRGWIKKALYYAPFIVGVVAFVWYLFVKSLQALLLVLVGLIAASGRRRPLGFGQLFTISTYALTTGVLIDCALAFLPINIPFFTLIYLSLAAIYTALGTRRVPDEPLTPTATPPLPMEL